jgi:hypothetical protein
MVKGRKARDDYSLNIHNLNSIRTYNTTEKQDEKFHSFLPFFFGNR